MGVVSVTDVVAKQSGNAAESSASEPSKVMWAPTEPRPASKKRLALGIGIPAAVLVAGAVAASLVLIAPGTAVAGVPIGFLTPGAATEAIENRLAQTEITLGEGGPTVTGAELGATVDAEALAAAAFDENPMWNLTSWFGESSAVEVTVDPEVATAALRTAAPDTYTAPTPATVAFEGKTYGVTEAVDGAGIDVDAVAAALQDAFAAGESATTIEVTLAPVASPTTTEKAQATADHLNGLLKTIGFYVDDERTVPISAERAATWFTIDTDDEGDFTIAADEAEIQKVVDTLPEKVNQDPKNANVIVNAAGTVLRTNLEGQDGRVLGATAGVAAAFATQLTGGGDAAYALPVEVTPHTTTEVARLLEVDISEQRLYLKENGAVIDSWLVSTGRYGADTVYGRYNIGWKTPIQDMTGTAADSGKKYIQEDVRWAMYFNGDQAFHGVYWHSNWGNRMSAGCVGMPEWRAEQIYGWAPEGTDVWIHD